MPGGAVLTVEADSEFFFEFVEVDIRESKPYCVPAESMFTSCSAERYATKTGQTCPFKNHSFIALSKRTGGRGANGNQTKGFLNVIKTLVT